VGASKEDDRNKASGGGFKSLYMNSFSSFVRFVRVFVQQIQNSPVPCKKKVVTLVVYAQPAADFAAGVREMQ
jgi:hypothetical protein